MIEPFSGKVIRPDPEVEMRKLVQSGAFKYLETEIPRLYHSIVKRKCLDKVRQKTGAFFGGLSPDIFAAVAIANFTEKVVSIDYPLTIAGISKSSGTAQSVRGEHVGNLEDAPHFRYRGTYKWAEIVPRFYSVETIWADAAVAALKALGRDDILRDLNLPLLAAHCVVTHPKYTHIILRDMYKYFGATNKNQLIGTFQFCYSLLRTPGRSLIKFVSRGIRFILLGVRINDVKDIVEATHTMTDCLRKTKNRFSNFVS